MNDVDLKVGADTSAAATGLAELKNYGQKVQTDLSSIFAKTIAFTGLIAGIKAVVDYGDRIYDLGQRFGVSTTLLQQFGNAAEQNGSSLDAVAQAFNKLIIAQAKVNNGDAEMIEHLNNLGVSAKEFAAADPGAAMVMLGNSTKNAADIVQVLGRNALELLPTISGLADGSIQMGHAMSEDAAKGLNDISDALLNLKEIATTVAGPAVVLVFKGLSMSLVGFSATMAATSAAVVGHLQIISRAFHGDFAGIKPAIDEMEKNLNVVKDKFAHDMAVLTGDIKEGPTKRAVTTDSEGSDATTIGGSSSSTLNPQPSTSSGSGSGAIDRLADRQRQHDLEQLGNADKLKFLELEREEIQDNLTRGQEEQTLTQNDQAELELRLLQNDEDRSKIQASSLKAESEMTEAREKAAEAAEKEELAQQRRLQILQLELSGHGDLVESLQQGWEFEDRINDLAQQISDAYRSGNDELGDTLTLLQEQVKQEEKLTAEKQKQKDLADAIAAQAAASLVTSRGLLGGSALAGGGGFGGFQSAEINDPRVQALIAAGVYPTQHAFNIATDSRTGQIDMEKLVREMILEFQSGIAGSGGGTRDIGFIARAQDAARNAALSASEGAQSAAGYATQQANIQSIINEILNFGTYGGGGGIFQQMLAQLAAIRSNLESQPGSH